MTYTHHIVFVACCLVGMLAGCTSHTPTTPQIQEQELNHSLEGFSFDPIRIRQSFSPTLTLSNDELKETWEFETNFYSRSGNTILYNDEVIPDADADSFIPLLFFWAKDKHALYYDGIRYTLDNTDDVLLYLGSEYLQHNNTILLKDGDSLRTTHIDPKSFTLFAQTTSTDTTNPQKATFLRTYTKDAQHVFFLGEILEQADPASFVPASKKQNNYTIVAPHLAHDNKHYFYKNSIISEEEFSKKMNEFLEQ